MGDVSKFIPINGNGENEGNNIFGGIENVGTTENCGTTNNPNTTENTWEAGNVTIPGIENCNTTGNSSTTENTWSTGNTTTIGVNTTGSSNVTSNPSSTGNTWRIANSSTTGTTSNSIVTNGAVNGTSSEFKVCGSSNNLPARTTFWTKIRNFFFYTEEELAAMKAQKEQQAGNIVCEGAPQESVWSKIKKLFSFENKTNEN